MRVLIYQIGQLGDNIVSIPAIRAVREHFGKEVGIHVLYDVHSGGLVTADMVLSSCGAVDEFVPYRFARTFMGKLRTAMSVWRRVRRLRIDVVISMLPSDRPAEALRRDRFFFRLCGISKMIGFDPIAAGIVHPRDEAGRPVEAAHEAILRLRRLRIEGIGKAGSDYFHLPFLDLDAHESAPSAEWLCARRLHPEKALIALCPGCKQDANRWPVGRFVEIGRRILDTGLAEPVLVGGPAERAVSEHLVREWGGRGIAAAGRFSVSGSAWLLSQCSMLIGLDTGTTHLAAAMGVPCVVIQGAQNNPGLWAPLGDGHTIIRHPVPCAGCLFAECPVAGHPCLEGITVDEVWRSVRQSILRTLAIHAPVLG